MSATNRGCERKAYDFYATPPETVRAFLANFDGISAGDRILEPSAGNGQIVKVLREGGYDNRIDAVELRPEERGTLEALTSDASNLFGAAQGHQTGKGRLNHVLGILGAHALRTDVGNTSSLHNGTNCTAGDHASTGGSGHHQNSASAVDAGNLVGNGSAGQGDLDHVLLGVGNALQDCLGNLGSLAQAIADLALTVANHNQCGAFDLENPGGVLCLL